MHVVSWETNKTRFSKYTSPQIGKTKTVQHGSGLPYSSALSHIHLVIYLYYYMLYWLKVCYRIDVNIIIFKQSNFND